MENYEWPWQYSFPPFFTLQPHAETRARQLSAWRNLILDYHRIKKESILDIQESIRSPLFYNQSIDRKVEPEFLMLILNNLMQSKNASPCDKNKNRWEIYWHTLDEWASLIYNYVVTNGLTNTVCTFFELTQGDDVVGEDFYGLNEDVLHKALKVLENQRKCEIIAIDDKFGVKFY